MEILSRRVCFVPSKTDDTRVDCASAFFKNNFPHHGLPDDLVSDHDPKSRSKFWGRLMSILKMSPSRDPQTDGASQVMNRMVENYLHCYCNYQQNDSDELLLTYEFACNSAASQDLGKIPFEVDLGWNSTSPLDMISGIEVPNESVEEFKLRLKC